MVKLVDFIQNLIALAGSIEALIGVIAGLAVSAIVAYKQIRKAWAEKELTNIIAALSTIAEDDASELGKAYGIKLDYPDTNESKAFVVAEAATQIAKKTNPGLLKRLKLDKAVDILPLVNTIYQGAVKPLIKAIKK